MTDSTHTPQTARLLDCGYCFEENGEEVHPHPECPIVTVARYHRRADEVQAVQWTGSNEAELRAFAPDRFATVAPQDRIDPEDDAVVLIEESHWVAIRPGCWVLKYVDHFDVEADAYFRVAWGPAAGHVVSSPPATDRATLRERIRRAVCEAEGFAWDSDMLEPDEYGDVADMVLAVLPPTTTQTAEDRARVSAKLWAIAEHHIVAEWICCEPLEPRHELCAKGYAALGMVKTLLVDADPAEAWNPSAPLLDAVLPPPADRGADELAAATCSAQYHCDGDENGPRLCIRGAQHAGKAHTDEHGFHWSDTVAVYPLADGTFRTGINLRAVLRRMADEAQQQPDTETRCDHCKQPGHSFEDCPQGAAPAVVPQPGKET